MALRPELKICQRVGFETELQVDQAGACFAGRYESYLPNEDTVPAQTGKAPQSRTNGVGTMTLSENSQPLPVDIDWFENAHGKISELKVCIENARKLEDQAHCLAAEIGEVAKQLRLLVDHTTDEDVVAELIHQDASEMAAKLVRRMGGQKDE